MNFPIGGSTLLGALLRPGGEGHRPQSMVQALLTGGAGAGVPVAPGQGTPQGLVFSALVAATGAQPGAASPVPVGPAAGGAAPRDAAVAAPGVDLDELLASLVAMPGMVHLPAAIARFVQHLQQIDAGAGAEGALVSAAGIPVDATPGEALPGEAIRGNLAGKLVAKLTALDPESLALLESAATDPASLFAALAELAGLPAISIPVAAPGEALPGAGRAQARPENLAAPTLMQGLREAAAALTDRSPAAAPLSPVEGMAKPAAGMAAPAFALRGLVVEAVSPNTSTSAPLGAERDGIALPSPATESRAASAASLTPLRPAEPAPSFAFARQITQQIRGASFTDGQTRIALTPRGLGEIEIDLRADEAGKLRIVLRAENPAVLQALRGDRDGLLLALTDGGAGGKGADLSFEDFSRRGRQGAEPGPQSGNAPAPQNDREETASPTLTPYRPLGTGTLDMLT